MNKYKNNLILLITAMIWGGAFIEQSSGMDYVGPWTFTCVRSFEAALFTLISYPLIKKLLPALSSFDKKETIIGGLCCGLALTPATIFQQIGIQYTTVGKAGFITALYCIIVPFLSVFLKKKVTLQTWIAALISLVGFYFLSIKDSLSLDSGDTYMLCSAFFFAIHILVIDHFTNKANGVLMSATQFFIVGLLSIIPSLMFENPSLIHIKEAIIPIIYAGILSNGVGYTLQIIGQRGADPTIATLILSLESVFSVIGGFLVLHEILTLRELFGCALVFTGVILAQIKK